MAAQTGYGSASWIWRCGLDMAARAGYGGTDGIWLARTGYGGTDGIYSFRPFGAPPSKKEARG